MNEMCWYCGITKCILCYAGEDVVWASSTNTYTASERHAAKHYDFGHHGSVSGTRDMVTSATQPEALQIQQVVLYSADPLLETHY